MDRLEDMRTFVAIAEDGVTGAAQRLRLAPSAVSRRLKDLEMRLGTDLMTRTTRQMTLTDAGRDFLSDCARILEDVTAAEARVRDGSMAPTGVIRIAAPLSFGISHIQPILNRFMARCPGVQIEIDLDDRRVDIQRERYDLAIRIGELEDSSLQARKLARFRLLAVASPTFVDSHGRPDQLSDLADMPALCYSAPSRPEIWVGADKNGRRKSVKVSARMISNNGDILRDAAIAGLGAALLPEFIAGRALAEGRLMTILEQYTWRSLDVYAIRPARQYLPQRVRNLIDYLAAELAGDVGLPATN